MNTLVDDLCGRLVNRVQLTTDGLKAYLNAVEEVFGDDVVYAQLVKLYKAAPEAHRGRYSPAEGVGAREETVTGNPDKAHVPTSYVERSNLWMHMHNRRLTRMADAFSKKAEDHPYAQAPYFMFYNFVRMPNTLKMSPASAAVITDRLWDMTDIVALIDARAQAPKPPASYRE